jgi:pilus assembly protein CpaF
MDKVTPIRLAEYSAAHLSQKSMSPETIFGPIFKFMSDPTIEEIWINSPSRVFVARNGLSQLTNLVLTPKKYSNLLIEP